ncbi:hypothetical protein V865_000102 [Kwoniella europaea PYCC6329]|uniref:Methyltransferase type 11 domain-containing protein n=1 Tax=Kwoniella europaea PYCC6329 TaxID=1423913 RepID=A0AAX4K7C4_9TREE
MSYSDTPIKRTQRLSLQPDTAKGPRRTESIRKYVMSPSPISVSSIDTSSELSSTSMGRSGDKIRWRDRTVYRIGRNDTGGYPIDLVEQERQEAEGTGIWAINMADLFPHVDVIGIDEVDIQPELVPPNCESDLSKPLPYPPSSFDIIHIRFLSTRVRSYPSILSQAQTLLKPTGLLLLFENFTFSPPQTVQDKTPKGVQAFYDCYKRTLSSFGIKVCSLEDVVGTLRGGSGGDIKGDLIKVPIGHGPGRMTQLSKIHLINLKAWIESTRYTIVEGGGYTNNEFDILSSAFIDDLEKEELYTCYHSLWVKKPTNIG